MATAASKPTSSVTHEITNSGVRAAPSSSRRLLDWSAYAAAEALSKEVKVALAVRLPVTVAAVASCTARS